MFIYKITNNINNKIYVGITTKSVLNRFQRHCVIARTTNKHNKKYLHYAMMKYGWINFSVETLEECNSIEDLKSRESYWIEKLDSNNSKIGYNLTKGGDGITGYTPTQEVKDKISKSNSGRVQSIDERKRRSESLKNVKMHENSIANLKIGRNIGKKIFKINTANGEIEVYPTISSAVKENKKDSKLIYKLSKNNLDEIEINGYEYKLNL